MNVYRYIFFVVSAAIVLTVLFLLSTWLIVVYLPHGDIGQIILGVLLLVCVAGLFRGMFLLFVVEEPTDRSKLFCHIHRHIFGFDKITIGEDGYSKIIYDILVKPDKVYKKDDDVVFEHGKYRITFYRDSLVGNAWKIENDDKIVYHGIPCCMKDWNMFHKTYEYHETKRRLS